MNPPLAVGDPRRAPAAPPRGRAPADAAAERRLAEGTPLAAAKVIPSNAPLPLAAQRDFRGWIVIAILAQILIGIALSVAVIGKVANRTVYYAPTAERIGSSTAVREATTFEALTTAQMLVARMETYTPASASTVWGVVLPFLHPSLHEKTRANYEEIARKAERLWQHRVAVPLGAAIGGRSNGLITLAGCAQRYDRVAVVGLVVPVRAPAPGTTLQALPPLDGLPVAPDTSDGAVLIEVDQQRFWQDHGSVLPAWQAGRAGAADPHLDDLRELSASIAAIRALLDDVFAAAAPRGAAAAPAGAAAPEVSRTSADAGPRRASLVLGPEDWSGLTARLATLAARIDALASAARQDDGLGGSGGAHDGEAIHRRLAEAQWAGLEPLAVGLAAQAGDLGVDGAFAALRRHPAHGAAAEDQLDRVRTAAQQLAQTVRQRESGQVVTAVRLVARSLDGLAASPLSALAFSGPHPAEPLITRAERDQSRVRLAGLRQALAVLTARWAANNAALLLRQPLPTLVWQPAAKVD